MPAPLHVNATLFNADVTPASALPMQSPAFSAWYLALERLALNDGPSTITCNAAGNYLMTTKLGRTYAAVLNPVTDTRAITSSGFTLAELLTHNPVVESFLGLLKAGVTSASVTYA